MDPVAFSIFGIDIRWYGIIISIGVLVGLLLAEYNCKVKYISFDELTNMFLVAFPIAIIGARLYYVIFNLSYYSNNIGEIFNIRKGGLAIHGGVIFGLLSAYIYAKYKKYDFWKFADVIAPSIILAQGIGRWGNFFNGEAHGGSVSYNFISKFPDFIQKGMFIEGIYYNPTFLYESIWNICVCLILIYVLRNTSKKGIVIFTYIGLYSLGRFFIEGLRTDSLMLGSLRIAQLVSLLGIILWISYILILRLKYKK